MSDEIQIKVQNTEIKALPTRKSPLHREWVGSSEIKDDIDVFISRPALIQAMEDGRRRGSKNETGGVLAGRCYMDSTTGRQVTEITDYFPGELLLPGATHVTFTADTWAASLRQIDRLAIERQDPSVSMVGWYHTHPRFGIFLSRDDQHIQDKHFTLPGHVAIVFDPIEESLGIFSSGGTGPQFGSARRHNGYYLYEPEPEVPFEINFEPVTERQESQENLQQAVETIYGFVLREHLRDLLDLSVPENARTSEQALFLIENPQQQDGDLILGFVARRAQEEIARLSRITDSADRQAAIERARYIREITEAYKVANTAAEKIPSVNLIPPSQPGNEGSVASNEFGYMAIGNMSFPQEKLWLPLMDALRTAGKEITITIDISGGSEKITLDSQILRGLIKDLENRKPSIIRNTFQ